MKRSLPILLGLLALGHSVRAVGEQPSGLTPAQQKQLERDKIIITDRTWKQIFTPYIFAGQPVFITSDSALNAFHVLLEESLARMEETHSAMLAAALEKVLAKMKEAPPGFPAEKLAAAQRRGMIVLGTAARLAGSKWSGGAEVDGLIAEQVRLAEAAQAVSMPSWLPAGFGVAAIDYRVFKPAGFYTRSGHLQRYFRAMRWLQSVPFRARIDAEMEAAAVMGEALHAEGTLVRLAASYRNFGGAAAEPDVVSIDDSPLWEQVSRWKAEQKSDTARMVLLSAVEVPDAVLFRLTTGNARPYPDPLEVGAWLGSPVAEELLKKSAGDTVLGAVRAHRESLEENPSFYVQYLRCAAMLLTPPEPGAPGFMASEPWRRKSLNTAMAGWAQLRHAWALQAKEDALCFPAGHPYPGFVEPNPAFFHALGELILQCVNDFDEVGALEQSTLALALNAAEVIPQLEAEAAGLKKRLEPYAEILAAAAAGKNIEDEGIVKKIEEAGRIPDRLCEALRPFARFVEGISYSMPGSDVDGVHNVDKALAGLRDVAAGRKNEAILKECTENGTPALRRRWLKLLSVVHQSETIAHRQLRGVELTSEEASFIVDYGETLGGILFYDGNSYHGPHDDAPRVAAVFNRAGDKFLLAGTGRPREIRVLYPWQGKEVLCRGAIMPFHEFFNSQHLTDAEWKERLDSKNPPAAPAWLQPLLVPNARAAKPEE